MKRVFLFLIISILANTSQSWALPAIDLEAIKLIESGGIADAVSPRGAIGLYQITPIALQDFNRCTGKSYSKDDLYAFWINKEIARWLFTKRIPQILKSKKQAVTIRHVLISWNAGHKWVGKKRIPRETKNFLEKYRKAVRP